MIRLSGQVDYAFGNFPCLRGFAPLGDLADNSEADPSYQREPDSKHLMEVQSFLADKENTFFPELIFGVSLERLGLKYDKQQEFYNILDNPLGMVPKKLVPNFVLQISRKLTTQTARTLTIIFSDSKLKLSRIDGNHRLEAVPDQQDDSHNIRSRIAPFCLIIFNTEERYEYFAPYFFHTINYRAQPIPKEKNLEIILQGQNKRGDYILSDSRLIEDSVLGIPYLCAREIAERLTNEDIPFIFDVLKGKVLTFFLDVSVFLSKKDRLSQDAEKTSKEIIRTLNRIDSILPSIISAKDLSSRMLIPMVYYLINKQKDEFDLFIKWLSKNDLVNLSSIEPETIMTIFENIHRRGPYKVFVAMPYVSHKRDNDFNKLFKEVLNELNTNGVDDVKYELIPIMRFRGAAQRIDQRLIRCIRECDIFIADISSNNENVIFEVGLSEGTNKPMLLIKEDNDKIPDKCFYPNEEYIKNNSHPPFDMDKLQYIPYSSTGYYNDIKRIIKNNLPVIVNEYLSKKNCSKE